MKKALIGLGIILGAVILLGIIAPKEMVIEKEVTINRPTPVVFDYLKHFSNQSMWSPWEKLDPKMTKSSKGTDGEVGFISSWAGNNKVGVGEQEIKAIVPNERIEFELRFEKPMKDVSQGFFTTETVNETQTRVKWGMKGKSPFPRNIICLLLNVKKSVGQNFEDGLSSLKTTLEKN